MCPGARSGHAWRRRSRPCRCATGSPAAISSSSFASCLAECSQPALLMRSCSAPARRFASPTGSYSARSAAPTQSTSTRPAGACRAASALSGARSQNGQRCSGSRPTGTSGKRSRCSESNSPGSRSPTAGGPTTASTRSDGKRVGRICCATSLSTPKGQAPQTDFGEAGLRIAGRVFDTWQQFQADGDRQTLINEVEPLKHELRALLVQASQGKRNKRTWGLSKNLLKLWPALWTFSTVAGVEPTNNAAERGLRGAVIYRKLSLGSQSEAGEHMIERLLSISQTCRLQQRSMLTYLTDALTATARGDPLPTLV